MASSRAASCLIVAASSRPDHYLETLDAERQDDRWLAERQLRSTPRSSTRTSASRSSASSSAAPRRCPTAPSSPRKWIPKPLGNDLERLRRVRDPEGPLGDGVQARARWPPGRRGAMASWRLRGHGRHLLDGPRHVALPRKPELAVTHRETTTTPDRSARFGPRASRFGAGRRASRSTERANLAKGEHTVNAVAGGLGFGWAPRRPATSRCVPHDGGIDGFASRVTFVPDRGVGVVVLANLVDAELRRSRRRRDPRAPEDRRPPSCARRSLIPIRPSTPR